MGAEVAEQGSALAGLGVQRPQRADARRNFDALLAAARELFAEQGTDASLEDVARRACVGIGTLYRNFPTRQDLFESVYLGEVEELCAAAEAAMDRPAWEGLSSWLRRFVRYVATKRALAEAMNKDSQIFRACRAEMYACGSPLLERAQAEGEARTDLSFDDLVRMVSGLTWGGFADDAQRDRILDVALDGLRARR